MDLPLLKLAQMAREIYWLAAKEIFLPRKYMKAISNRWKHRLRIAARFLRQAGNKFDGDNFYGLVMAAIEKLDQETQLKLREWVNWIEEYEIEEQKLFGEPSRSRASKNKNKFSRGRALHAGVSDA